METSLDQEDMDSIVYEARVGDLESLTELFTKYVSPTVLPSIKDDVTFSTPLHMAAANGHTAVAKFLLSLLPKEEAVKMVNNQNESGNTPLHWASYNGHLEIVKLLVEEYGADVFLKNSLSHDALFEAENNNQAEVENWFLLKFAIENDVKVEDDGENTKITYTPGSESHELDKEASKAQDELRALEVASQTEKLAL